MKFCRSCDVCQRTTSKGSVAKISLGKLPLMVLQLRRVAVDLIGSITPAKNKGHCYELTLVDYATRNPEVVSLKNIDTETMMKPLLDLYSRFVSSSKYQWKYLVILQASLHQNASLLVLNDELEWKRNHSCKAERITCRLTKKVGAEIEKLKQILVPKSQGKR